MKTIKILAVAGLIFAITGCCACRRSKSQVPLHGTEWKLSQLYGAPVESNNYRMTLEADGKVSGIGECNRFSGTYTLNDKALKFADNMIATKMMCLTGMERENRFLAMLRETDSYSIDGTRLMLIKGGDVLAIFDPVPVETPASGSE